MNSSVCLVETDNLQRELIPSTFYSAAVTVACCCSIFDYNNFKIMDLFFSDSSFQLRLAKKKCKIRLIRTRDCTAFHTVCSVKINRVLIQDSPKYRISMLSYPPWEAGNII